MRRPKTQFPRFTQNFRDRYGELRSYFRRGSVRVMLPEPVLGEAYWEAYRAALADYIAGRKPGTQSQVGANRIQLGTVAHAFVLYIGSTSFKNGLLESTRTVHFNILSRWRDQWGDRRLKQLQRRHVVDWLNERVDTPAAAQVFLKVLRRFMQYCLSINLIEADPTQGIKAPSLRSEGIHTWTDDEIGQYRRHHRLSTNARLALELLIGTAQRRSDVVRMGRQHVRGDMLHVKQKKTGWEGDIPIGDELAAALAAVHHNHLTFLVTAWGEPFTAAGFGNHFRQWVDQADLPKRCSSHGLRKAACRHLAEAGCTAHEIAAISGHMSLAEVARYTRAVDQQKLARAARAKERTQTVKPSGRFDKTGG